MRRKSLIEVRAEAARLAREAAAERRNDGDPEGAGVLLDLAREIGRIKLTITAP